MTNATSSMAGTSATRSGYGPLMKFSLLSVSLLLTSSNAISGVMPALIKQFPDQPRANVELLSTVPSFSMIIMIIASGFIARKIGDKATVTAGLGIAAIFGIIPFLFTGNFWVIMGSRIGLGVGFGLINSLAVSMIAKFFSGDEKATLMGFRSAFESLGQSLMKHGELQEASLGFPAALKQRPDAYDYAGLADTLDKQHKPEEAAAMRRDGLLLTLQNNGTQQ